MVIQRGRRPPHWGRGTLAETPAKAAFPESQGAESLALQVPYTAKPRQFNGAMTGTNHAKVSVMQSVVFLVLSLAPALAALLSLALVALLVARMHAVSTAPYEPSMGDVDAWHASLDVALGDTWWGDSLDTAPDAHVVAPRPAKRLPVAARPRRGTGVRTQRARVIGQRPSVSNGVHGKGHATYMTDGRRHVMKGG